MAREGDILGYARVSTAEQDLSSQEDRLTREGAIRVFGDVISGRTFERPGLTALLDYARPGDTLAVIRLDRLGRSLRELVFHVFGAIAHFERRLISERTKDGLATARKHGRTPGRPPLREETVSALQDLVSAGKSVSQAARHLGIGRSTAYKAMGGSGRK